MTYFITIKHPNAETFVRSYPSIHEAKQVYIALGMIPGGFKSLSNEDHEVVRAEHWPVGTPTSGSVYAGQLAAFSNVSDNLDFSTSFGRVEPESMIHFRESVRSSIRNALECKDGYSEGVAVAMRRILMMIDCRDSMDEEQVKHLRSDLQTLKHHSRMAHSKEVAA